MPRSAGKRATLSVKVSAQTLEAIDDARGDMTRSGWLRHAISLRLAHALGASTATSSTGTTTIPVVVLKQGIPDPADPGNL